MTNTPLGALNADEFLRDYWQKQPLLIRDAIADFQCPLSPDELAGLACDDDVESRIVLEKDGSKPWECRNGPFEENAFAKLPPSHWTLLIQECNKHVLDIALLLDRFNFIPNWRVDDVMVSYAPIDGSVGPHVDQYDVFLIQGLGQRRWQIHTQPVDDNDFIPDLDLRILKHFVAEEEWILNPGDMLYLPPGVAHYGVALEDCLTLSVGFRAPSYAELISSFVEYQISHLDNDLFAPRYRDPELQLQQHPGEISPGILSKIHNLINNELNQTKTIERWFASFVTEPKHAPLDPIYPEITPQQFLQDFKRLGVLYRSEYSRFSFIRLSEDEVSLYIDGDETTLTSPLQDLAPMICDQRQYEYATLAKQFKIPAIAEFFTRLTNAGKLWFAEE
jgi:50S ribosomal protein L16 3-hydroxylase